ncbi:MAG: FAD-binding protein [Bacillota bacterium]
MSEADLALDSRNSNKIFGVDGNLKDSPYQFYLVEKHVRLASKYISELRDLGLEIDTLIKTGGHKYPRGLWTSGEKVVQLLKKEIKNNNIEINDNSLLIDLISVENKINGALILSLKSGEVTFYRTKAVILATGGASNLYSQNTNSPFTTGDGMAAAYRANAELVDMEFPMFLPFTVIKSDLLKEMVFPYDLIINLNAHMLNKRGERYILDWAPQQKEKTTRDINSIAAEMEVKNGNGNPNDGVYMSFKHLPNNIIKESANWLPDNIKNWKYGEINYKDLIVDLNKDALEVKPGCHFWNGGIKIDINSSTNINGLYACGEGTGGIHGSNRISGNALTQALVWGGEAGKYCAIYLKDLNEKAFNDKKIKDQLRNLKSKIFNPILDKKGHSLIEVRDKLHRIAENYLRPVRSKDELNKTEKLFNSLEEQINNQFTNNKRMIF